MYGYHGYTPGQSTTYTTSAVAAAVAAAYSGSTNPPQQPPNVFGYPSASTFGAGLDGSGAAPSNAYYAYGYGTPSASAVASAYPNIGAGAGYASLSDISYAAKGRAPYGATAPKPNPALTTLTTANKPISSYGSTYDAAVYAAASTMLNKGGPARSFPAKKPNPFAFPPNNQMGGGVGGGSAPTHKYSSGKRWGIGANATTHRDAQQFYCETCKISCAGQLTYKEHLEGKLHKKKELLAKGEGTQALPRSKVSFRCDLCNVTCTGKDTYDAHVRGSKHQRTLALCKKLGKPIPTNEPTIIAPAEMGGTLPPPVNIATPAVGGGKIPTIGSSVAGKKIAPVHFVGGSSLETTKQTKDLEAKKAVVAAAVGSAGVEGGEEEKKEVEYDLSALLAAENNVKPVGEDYVETERDANGKHVTYVCKLCDCKFSDINAKDIHLKGRRHRLMYKQKVDPSLEVEMKPNTLREKRAARAKKEGMGGRMRGPPDWMGVMGPGGPHAAYMPPPMGRFAPAPMPRPYFDAHRYVETEDDRHIMMKHSTIFPNETEMKEMEELIHPVEKGLKLLSDHFESTKPKEEEGGERLLKGAMRIGVLSKGLMKKGEEEVELVAIFALPPTKKMLEETAEKMRELVQCPGNEFTIDYLPDEAALVYTVKDKLPRVKVYLTSTVLRQEDASGVEKPSDILREEKCLHALAELRHSKWFQVRCTGLQSCQVVLRILRDVAKRIDTYKKLSPWTTELIVEKVISSVGVPIPVGDALRRFFEAVSTGMLFEDGPGVMDPCEKESFNVLSSLSPQDRENITSSAQHALRLIAFGQVHKILGMDKLAPVVSPTGERKRPREEEENGTHADGEAKKDKPDVGENTGEGEKMGMNESVEGTGETKVVSVKMETN